MVENFERIPSILVSQESTGDTGEDEKSSEYAEPRVKPGVESNLGR